jgi:hypothetical protein
VWYWYIDKDRDEVAGGLWSDNHVDITSKDPGLYQVVDVIGADEVTFSLTFSAKTSWYSESVNSIFSVSDADSSVREEIDREKHSFNIDPENDITSTDWATYKHVLSLSANSEYAGKNLILEFTVTSYDYGGEVDNGWVQIEFVSLVKETSTNLASPAQTELRVYPNPASRTLYINSDLQVSCVNVYSVTGTLMKSVKGHDISRINVEGLGQGLYIISLTTEQGVIKKRFEKK